MNQVLSSLLFKFLERGGTQFASFVIGVFLARVLSPADYGVLAILTLFTAVAQVFVQPGLSAALIQSRQVEDGDASSVLWASLGASALFYAVLFFCAPLVARFYDMPKLTALLRVLSLMLLPGAFVSVQSAVLTRAMRFQKLMVSSIAAMVLSGGVGIGMAYAKCGIWSLVCQQLTYQTLFCVLLWRMTAWRPRLCLNLKRLRQLLSFGWKLLCATLLDTVYQDLSGLVIGKRYGAQTLGFYNRGRQFPVIVDGNVNGTVQSVLLPVLSKAQDDKALSRAILRRAVVTGSFVVFPIMAGLAAVAEPLVRLLLTDKWLPCVPYLRVLCLAYAFSPVSTANLQAVSAQGRGDVFLRLEIVKKAVGVCILLLSVLCFDSPLAIAAGHAVYMAASVFINTLPGKRLLGYGFWPQARDVAPGALLSLAMGAVVYALGRLPLPLPLLLAAQVLLGVGFYALGGWAFRMKGFQEITKAARRALSRGDVRARR